MTTPAINWPKSVGRYVAQLRNISNKAKSTLVLRMFICKNEC